jgi:hypothetical protein
MGVLAPKRLLYYSGHSYNIILYYLRGLYAEALTELCC